MLAAQQRGALQRPARQMSVKALARPNGLARSSIPIVGSRKAAIATPKVATFPGVSVSGGSDSLVYPRNAVRGAVSALTSIVIA